MELDFIKNYNNKYPDDSVFVLKHFTKEELTKLSGAIDVLLEKNLNINLANLDYIKNLSENELILKTGEENKGIIKVKENMYECILKKAQYVDMKYMLMNYEITETAAYHWLYDVAAEIEFLLSDSGYW
jgi:hypothetical protein